jgi:hypothetical protein
MWVYQADPSKGIVLARAANLYVTARSGESANCQAADNRRMNATVRKLGGSAAVRRRIVIEPIRQKTYDLRRLLKRINAKNRHEAVDFGPPVGKEVW